MDLALTVTGMVIVSIMSPVLMLLRVIVREDVPDLLPVTIIFVEVPLKFELSHFDDMESFEQAAFKFRFSPFEFG